MGSTTMVIMIATNLCVCGIYTNFFFKIATPRRGWRGHWLTCYGLYAIYCFAVIIIYSNNDLKVVINLLVMMFVIHFCFSIKLSTNLLLSAFTYLATLIAEVITISLFTSFGRNGSLQSLLETTHTHVAVSIVNFVFVYILMELAAITLKRGHVLRQKKMVRFALLPASQYFYMFAIFMSTIPDHSGPIFERNIMLSALTLVLFLIADIIIVGSVPHVIAASRQEEIKRITDLERSQFQQRYMQLEQQEKELRKLRHDMINHLATFRAMLEQHNLSDAEAYSAKLAEQYRKSID